MGLIRPHTMNSKHDSHDSGFDKHYVDVPIDIVICELYLHDNKVCNNKQTLALLKIIIQFKSMRIIL